MNRREFLTNVTRTGPALALGGAMLCNGYAAASSAGSELGYILPDHLPKKLSIGMFIWNWITMATPGEPYDDLERVMAGLPERGFNAVRVDAGLNWCFTTEGRPRGEIEFGPVIHTYHDNITSFNAKGGGRHNVLDRVLQLMRLARKYGIYVILTSWEYQDSTWFVSDPAIRAEVMGIPEPQRFMHLARQHDRLLRILEDKGFEKNIAYIEVHNEHEASRFPTGLDGKRLHEEAIAFLRDHHRDILVSADYCTHDTAIVADNTQVYDQHVYSDDLYLSLYAQTVDHKDFDPADPRKNDLLRLLLKEPFVPYDQFMEAAASMGTVPWRARFWMYHNLNVEAFDAWILKQYQRCETDLKANAARLIEGDAKEAARRKLPAVCDEGGYFYPPLISKFEVTPPGDSMFNLTVDLAIKHGYWGMMPTTYCGPEHPIWQNVEWLRTINQRFQAGRELT